MTYRDIRGLKSKCHGYPVYQAAIAGCINDILFGTKAEAEQLMNGYFCFKCNEACETGKVHRKKNK